MATKYVAYFNETQGVWRDSFNEAWKDYDYYRHHPQCQTVRLVRRTETVEIIMEEEISDV